MKFPAFKGTAVIKIAIGIVASIIVVLGGFMLVQNVFTKAADSAPRDLIISDITTNTVKIAWTTDQETQGVVEYGASPTSLNLFSPESQKIKTHAVEITLLSPATSYYFQIRIGETKYDNGGVPWTFATKIKQPVPTGLAPSPAPTSSSAFGPLKGSSLTVKGTPTPTVRIIPIASATPTLAPTYPPCSETDCQQICLKIGKGCSTVDMQRPGANYCLGKVSISGCYWITPTVMPTQTPTPANTPTPTLTPTPTQ